jgi:SAM-dependent methyltransferase
METEKIYQLDRKSIELFASKGTKDNKPRKGNPNGYKVRRVMQVVKDLSGKRWWDISILDLACGEGVYTIEAGLHGAHVWGIDARPERMAEGSEVALKHDLIRTRFLQMDIRELDKTKHWFDVILCLGILYHLAWKDIVPVLKKIYEHCNRMVVIDTHVATSAQAVKQVESDGVIYNGYLYREHDDDETEDERKKKQLSSMPDNTFSFWLTRESLFTLLYKIGFTSVYEVAVPIEPGKPFNRVTLVAVKGEPVVVSTYPWVNGK